MIDEMVDPVNEEDDTFKEESLSTSEVRADGGGDVSDPDGIGKSGVSRPGSSSPTCHQSY